MTPPLREWIVTTTWTKDGFSNISEAIKSVVLILLNPKWTKKIIKRN